MVDASCLACGMDRGNIRREHLDQSYMCYNSVWRVMLVRSSFISRFRPRFLFRPCVDVPVPWKRSAVCAFSLGGAEEDRKLHPEWSVSTENKQSDRRGVNFLRYNQSETCHVCTLWIAMVVHK